MQKVLPTLLRAPLAIALFLLSFSVFSQQNIEKWGIAASVTGGYVWAHKGSVDNLKAHVYGGLIGFRYQTGNRRQWHRIFNQPACGVDFLYMNYGTPNIIGSVYAIIPYTEFPIFKVGTWRFNLKIGTGLGYITQPYDVGTNVTNSTIGSHLNVDLNAHGVINIPFNKKSELLLAGGVTHFSNGNFKMPNLGVNTPELKIGYVYYLGQKTIENPLPDNMDTTRNTYNVSLAFGSKYTDYIFPNRVTVGVARFKYLRSLSAKSKFGGGLDLFYDEGNFYAENRTGTALKGKPIDALEVGVNIGHELQLGHLAAIADVGTYLYQKNKVKGPIYQRVGLRYNFTKKVAAYTAIKLHFARADYIEWGITYSLNR